MDENYVELKLKFAAALLAEPTDYKAATSIFGPSQENLSWRAIACSQWVTDPIVVAEKKRLLAEYGEASFLPTKEQLAKELFKHAMTECVGKEKTDALKAYAEIMGMIEKPGTININNNVNAVKENDLSKDWLGFPLDESNAKQEK